MKNPVDIIVNRITEATKRSPIAVFKNNDRLVSCFADTVWFKSEGIHDSRLVGIYDKTMDINMIRRTLNKLWSKR